MWENETDFEGYWKQQRVNLIGRPDDDSCFILNWPSMRNAAWQKTVIENLNQLTSLPLQELDLLASVTPVKYVDVTGMPNCHNMVPQLQPVNGTGVVWFGDPWHIWLAQNGRQDLFVGYQNVTGHSWNNLKTGGFSVETTGGFKLPPGVFLICGDRAWPGIPIRPVGGPCYLGQLTLFAPHMRDLLNPSQSQGRRSRRSIRNFDETCNDEVQLPSLVTIIVTSFFLPGGMAAINAKNIQRLACWGEKQSNLTSQMISALLTDVDSVRHATLQNRAAIDLLLLAHGHGCKDFEGMCCFNLSDHSQSIHQQLAKLRENMKHITEGHDPFSDWLTRLGMGGLVADLGQRSIDSASRFTNLDVASSLSVSVFAMDVE